MNGVRTMAKANEADETVQDAPVAGVAASPGAIDTLYDMPGHLIRRSQQVAVGLFMDEMGDLDMTPVQYAALMTIASHPGVEAARMSELVAFDRSTLADVIDRIESRGWIRRARSARDGRAKSLWLTPEGAAMFARVTPMVERVQERILEPLSVEERDVYLRLMRRLLGLHTGESRYGRAPAGSEP